MTFRTLTARITSAGLLAGYRRPAEFMARCRECPSFAATWQCPPLAADPLAAPFREALVVTVVASLDKDERSSLAATDVMARASVLLGEELARRARETGGRTLRGIGPCRLCDPQPCTRPAGRPCRHPGRLSPSLEACGIDVVALVRDLHGICLQWGAGGLLPATLTATGACLYS